MKKTFKREYDGWYAKDGMSLCCREMTRFWRLPLAVKEIDVVLNAREVDESLEVTMNEFDNAWGFPIINFYFGKRHVHTSLVQTHVLREYLKAHKRCFISVEVG